MGMALFYTYLKLGTGLCNGAWSLIGVGLSPQLGGVLRDFCAVFVASRVEGLVVALGIGSVRTGRAGHAQFCAGSVRLQSLLMQWPLCDLRLDGSRGL